MISGGYYIKARQIQDSEISTAPPHVREIWDWLIKEVNHKDHKNIKRGSTFKSLNDISEGLKWYVGYRKEAYSKSKCEMAMNWLRKRDMITTTKTTRGMIITICNYDTYQDPKNYETNNERTTKRTRSEQHSDTINKNVKKENNKYTINNIDTNLKTYRLWFKESNDRKYQEGYKKVLNCMCKNSNLPDSKMSNVLSMPIQLTYDNFESLINEGFSSDMIINKLSEMENYNKLNTKVNVFLVLKSWLNKDKK